MLLILQKKTENLKCDYTDYAIKHPEKSSNMINKRYDYYILFRC